jgi:hypothetical protein
MCCVMETCWSWFDVQCHGKLLLGMSSPFKLCARVCHPYFVGFMRMFVVFASMAMCMMG